MIDETSLIYNNISEVKQKIEKAAIRSGRKSEDVTLIAVTKTIEIHSIKIAVRNGLNNLGENRVQEICDKYGEISENCNWHLIGNLQTNKVKYIIEKVKLIHSLDRFELATEIQKQAEKYGKIIELLVQINISGEETKSGIEPQQTREFIKNISTFNNLKIRGLMTIAPNVVDSESVRHIFRELKKIFIDMKKENIDNVSMDYLSMGMSNDFEVAIEEGANIVRIGSAIFGKRS